MLRINNCSIFLVLILLLISSCKKVQEVGDEQSDKFVKFFGGYGEGSASDVILFGNGYAMTGSVQTTDSANQSFLIATDEFGNELSWSPVKFGGILNDKGNKIFRLQSGDFIIVGTQVVSLTEKDSCDILVTRIGVDGSIKWKKRYGGSLKDEGLFGIETTGNNIVIGGYTESASRAKDIILYKLDINGAVLWSLPVGTSKDEIGYDIKERNDSIIVVGSTNSYSNTGMSEVFIAMVDNNNGTLIKWDRLSLGNGDLSGVKISFIPNTRDFLLLSQYSVSNPVTKKICMMRLQMGTDVQLFPLLWSQSVETSEGEIAAALLLRSNDFVVIGNRINSNSNIFSRSFNFNGSVLDSAFLSNSGSQTVNAAILSNDGKICIAGSNIVTSKSQVALMKGLL